MNFDAVAAAPWFAPIVPFHFGAPMFDPVMILTMVLVMFVTMIESTGMFLALGDICDRRVTPEGLSAGLRADGLGTAIGDVNIIAQVPAAATRFAIGEDVRLTWPKAAMVAMEGGK